MGVLVAAVYLPRRSHAMAGRRRVTADGTASDLKQLQISAIRAIGGGNFRSQEFVSIRVHLWLLLLRDCLERRD
jgi:hypothetical protein